MKLKKKVEDYLIMRCPNLRDVVDKKGFFTGKSHYECSCTREILDYNYVRNVCNCSAVTGGDKNFWSQSRAESDALNNRYKTCNHYKRFGIRN